MGKVAGAALKVAAPEVAAARKLTPGMAPKDVNTELQRRRQDAAARSAAKRAAAAAPAPAPAAAPAPAPAAPPPTPGGGLPTPSIPQPVQAAASTGSGVLLGVFVWAGALAYLQGGSAGVKKFFAAKFFNKV